MGIEAIVGAAVDKVRSYWPDGDPGKLQQAATAYEDFAAQVEQSGQLVSTAARGVLAAAQGDGPDRFRDYHGKTDAGMSDLSAQARVVAGHLRDYADAIGQARDAIRSILIEIAAVAATAAAITFATALIGGPAAEAVAIARTGMLIERAAKVGIVLNATLARLAVKGVVGAATGAGVSLIEIPVIKAAKSLAGVDDHMNEGGWVLFGMASGGLAGVGSVAWGLRKLDSLGKAMNWGRHAARPVMAKKGLVVDINDMAKIEQTMSRLTYQTGREHALVEVQGVWKIVPGEPTHVFTPPGGRMAMHTHPWDWPKEGPSIADYEALHYAHVTWKVDKEYLLHRGTKTAFGIHDPAYKQLFPRG